MKHQWESSVAQWMGPRHGRQRAPQTPSTGLRHPSFGGRCQKAMLGVCVCPCQCTLIFDEPLREYASAPLVFLRMLWMCLSHSDTVVSESVDFTSCQPYSHQQTTVQSPTNNRTVTNKQPYSHQQTSPDWSRVSQNLFRIHKERFFVDKTTCRLQHKCLHPGNEPTGYATQKLLLIHTVKAKK